MRPGASRALWLLCLLVGCDAQGGRAAICRFGAEHAVVTTAAFESDGLALVALRERPGGAPTAVAVWSDPSGLFARRLSAPGEPVGPVGRLGARCRGGLAAQATPEGHGQGGFQVACLDTPVPPDVGASPDGEPVLRWLAIDAHLRPLDVRTLASVGLLSRGVALALSPDAGWVAFRDASANEQAVWLARAPTVGTARGGQGGSPWAPRRLSTRGRAAGHPALAFDRDRLRVAWAETYLEAGEPRAELRVAGPTGPAAAVATVHHDAVRPTWAQGPGGGLSLAFRDRRSRMARTGLYAALLGPGGDRLIGRPRRIARADGEAQPALVGCDGGILSATPRTYAGDHFVGVNVLASDLARRAPEQQFYQDAHEFSQAAAACVGGRGLLLIGERAPLHRPEVTLWAVPVVCAQ